MEKISDTLIDWYQQNKRELPWRQTTDPYKIWVSEIILQQTRVVQGYDYFIRFIERFPDVKTLAGADEDEVLKYWQGLGYYSRARNLHAAACSIADEESFPKTYKEIRALKGVGDYTAAAICSFAYDLPYAVVDGNVYRVLSRLMSISTPIDTTEGKKLFASLAQDLLDKTSPGIYNQAIMEFGALQCIPQKPNCLFCPLVEKCLAYQKGEVAMLPVKLKKIKITNRFFNYLYVHAGAYTFLNRRVGDDIWKNLYELPLIETISSMCEEDFYGLSSLHEMLAKEDKPVFKCVRRDVKHVLSHQIIYANFYEVYLPENTSFFKGFFKVKEEDLHLYAIPRLISLFLEKK